ncbi:MAG TPA: YabP/YqfC family sporulation protein [Candidatus Pullilachnospira intestinigallinarum]|nr:YabP/YqfC family sporulation protein [Candidatus Pullilachnospira intestinigallinarum]
MKKNRFPIWREVLAQSLELPRDLACRDALLTMTGTSELLLENYRSVLEYTPEHLLVLAANCRIRVEGKNLQIRFYNQQEMQIVGQIGRISFEL